MENNQSVIGGAGNHEARKNAQCILKPGRDQPESYNLGGILRQVRLREDAPLDSRKELDRRGYSRRRE